MVIKKKPVRELPKGYVPPGGIPFNVAGKTHKDVAGTYSAWNWEKVAAYHGLSDIWRDLIEFNFPTVAYEMSSQDKCAAVNWYLEERVGCKKSNDGKNYSFEGATVGIIYVPKVVTNPVGVRAARSVLSVLGSPLVHWIEFIFGGMSIRGTHFHTVGRAILDGKIGIAINPAELDHHAEAQYDYTVSPPMFYLRYSGFATPFQKSAVIHEAVHAISHMKGEDRDILLDEANAYVAQAIFHRKLTGRRVTYIEESRDDITEVADDLAQKVGKIHSLDQKDSQDIQKKLVKVYSLGTYNYKAYPFPK